MTRIELDLIPFDLSKEKKSNPLLKSRPVGCEGCRLGTGRTFVYDDGFRLTTETDRTSDSWPASEQDQPCTQRTTRQGGLPGTCRSTNVRTK